MNVKDLKDEYLGRYITVTDTQYSYVAILVEYRRKYGFLSLGDYLVRDFFENDKIELVV